MKQKPRHGFDELITTKEAVEYFDNGITHDCVNRWCRTQQLCANKMGWKWFTSRRAIKLYRVRGSPKDFAKARRKDVEASKITREECAAKIKEYEAEWHAVAELLCQV